MLNRARNVSVAFAALLLVATAGFGALAVTPILEGLQTHSDAAPSGPVGGISLANSPLMATLSVNRSSLDQPGSFTVQTAASGGNPSPIYVYRYYGMPAGCLTDEAQMWSCTPSESGSFNINVSVSDQNGNTTNSNFVSVMVETAITVNLELSSSSVQEGQSLSVTTTAGGGSGSYSFNYFGLPSGCGGYNSQSFSCDPGSTGQYSVYVNVTDTNGGLAMSNSHSLTVTSSGNGNGNGNGNGGSGNNSSNPFSNLLSGFSGVLSLLIIAGIVGFATWILLIVGVWIIAIVLYRRLPKKGAWPGTAPATAPTAAAAMVKCANCSAAIPTGSKFCPECGTSTASKTP
jgi:hypothetical protein